MLRGLDALQFFQKQLQVGLCDYKFPDAVFNRIVVFTDVIIYDKFSGAVVVGKALRLLTPIWGVFLVEKEYGQTAQPIANQGFSDLSLLCHKGIHSPSCPSKTGTM